MAHSSDLDHLLRLELDGTPYTCDGCGQPGFHSRYTCADPSCNFNLHKVCASPADTITHPFFPGCVFHFLRSGEPKRRCDACGEDITGYVYHCFAQGWDLHPSCAALPQVLEVGEVKLVLHHRMESKCNECGKKGDKRTWSYVSSREGCRLHVGCVMKMLLENWERKRCSAVGKWEKEHWCGGIEKREEEKQLCLHCDAIEKREQARQEPRPGIVLRKSKGKTGSFAKFKKIVKIAITFIMAALVGDPTALVAGLIASLIAH